jgi:hypothetical protein
MSGDMNTGLGNCLIMCALIYCYAKDVGLKHFELLNNGDDCVVMCDERDLHLLDAVPGWFLSMGYTMQVEAPVRQLEKVVFCQTQPVFDGSDYVMCRDPRVVLTKDIISLKNVRVIGSWRYYMQAIADCGLAAYGNLPLMSAFYGMLDCGARRSYQEYDSGLHFMSHGLSGGRRPIHHLARVSFWKAFGITPDRQCALEAWYDGSTIDFKPGPVSKIIGNTELAHLN